ncbi:ATP-dependent DNA ligase [Burkholderia cenocepacia]|uniref:ATP-dependent DNA ligase n=1 Tax=Burkholderia cenocepacia TaxID=95486 RepID=UPI001AA141C8|nr:ATP-dependent DNA ligase [Burkholderia cenocepacia]MBO1859371.1 ATP-dependent DNA ligase [Burkholderia cenocepacia]
MTIPTGFRPNLAATLTKPELIKFPVWASPKIDGIRCVFFGGVAYSRSLKPIPNPIIQAYAKEFADVLDGLDGELVVGRRTDPNCMQHSMAVMSKSDPLEAGFTFLVFDCYDTRAGFEERGTIVETLMQHVSPDDPRIALVPQHLVTGAEELAVLEAQFLEQGYEGMMIRDPSGMYKCGRSTEREGGLVKVKRFVDGEAVIVGFEEEMRNENEAMRNATGRTERSTAQAGLVGKETLGALVVRRIRSGIHSGTPAAELGPVFNIGTGFTAAQRRDYWQDRKSLVGRVVKFKHFDHGTVDAPRHPVFIGFRHPEDMG